MALNPNVLYPTQTTAPNASYPYGSGKNIATPGDNTGTPWIAPVINDIFGMQQALLQQAGIVPTNTADTAQASQYLDAMRALLGVRIKVSRYKFTGAVGVDDYTDYTHTVVGPRLLWMTLECIGGGGTGGQGILRSGGGGGGYHRATIISTAALTTYFSGGIGVRVGRGGRASNTATDAEGQVTYISDGPAITGLHRVYGGGGWQGVDLTNGFARHGGIAFDTPGGALPDLIPGGFASFGHPGFLNVAAPQTTFTPPYTMDAVVGGNGGGNGAGGSGYMGRKTEASTLGGGYGAGGGGSGSDAAVDYTQAGGRGLATITEYYIP